MTIMRTSDPPYKPSWVDRLTGAIDELPGSPWLVYLALAFFLVAAFIGIQAWQGAYRAEGFFVLHIFVAVQPIYGVMAVHYLDRVAADSLARFRPSMSGGKEDFDDAYYRLTTLPARQAGIAGLMGALFAAIQLLITGNAETIAAWQNVASTSISLVVHDVNIVLAWLGYSVLIYHAYHQLGVIDWLYTSKATIDPFRPQPLYALSEITSRTVLVGLPIAFGWYLVSTNARVNAPLSEPAFIFTMSLMLGLALLAFVWPLRGAHQLLVDAKNRALNANATNYRMAAEELHRAVSTRSLDEIDVWNKALAALDMERNRLDRLATWPWTPGAFRSVVIALLLPILIWIIQYSLQRILE